MNVREIFSKTISELSDQFGRMESECEKFGSTWGCKPDCPVFKRGKCELQEENEENFSKS